MAFHRRLKLPSFKLTARSTSGDVVQKRVPRSSLETIICSEAEQSSQDAEFTDTPLLSAASSLSADPMAVADSDTCDHGPGIYDEVSRKVSVTAWDSARESILKTVTEINAMPFNQLCTHCHEFLATFRCLLCGPCSYYCSSCLQKQHTQANIFHVPEEWKNGAFVMGTIANRSIDVHPNHACPTKRAVSICCVDEHGMEHTISVSSCQCEQLALTLIRARLWPATIQNPRLAFTFNLLDWAEALMYECQVALKDLWGALQYKVPNLKRRNIYPYLIDSFEEYRAMKHELRNPAFLCEGLDKGNVCPACPKESGKLVLSFDALFGLPRKRAAGVSYRAPLHGSLMFSEQSEIDLYVSTSPKTKQDKKSCSDFKAGNALRSASRYRALDETGIFGCACRHEFPKKFVNLKHGERLSYSVWMLQDILAQTREKSVDLYIMYDVACILQKHLQGTDLKHLLQEIHLSIPSFHAYGHEASCQVLMSPLRCPGIGLSDGEVLERMWSFLRRFGKMTKEMRPSHRIDVLTHALLHYGYKTKMKLASLLVLRWKRAQGTLALADQSLNKALSTSAVSETDVQRWIEEEKSIISSVQTSSAKGTITGWKLKYVHMLSSFYELREKVSAQPEIFPSGVDVHEQLSRLEEDISMIEDEHKVVKRWESSDFEYSAAKLTVVKEKQKQLSLAMWTAVVKRQMLLRLKAKYADGQKVAKRLSKQIGKESTKVKQLLEQYNVCSSILSYATGSLQDVLDPAGVFWTVHSEPLQLTLHSCDSSVPLLEKQDLVSYCLQKQRSTEEIEMLQAEMLNTLEYFWTCRTTLEHKIQELLQEDQTDFVRGSISVLYKQYAENEFIFNHAITAFNGIVPIPAGMSVPLLHDPPDYQSDDSECSDSDECSDDD